MTSYSDFHTFQAGDIVIPLDKAQDCGQTQAPEDLRVLSWNWATGGPSQGECRYAFVSLALNLKKKKPHQRPSLSTSRRSMFELASSPTSRNQNPPSTRGGEDLVR